MARTTLSVQDLVPTGLAQSYTAGDAANGMQFNLSGNTFLHVKNTGGGALTLTLVSNGVKVGGVAIPDQTVTVPATTGDRMIGPIDPRVFGQSGGLAYINLSTATGITLAALRLP